MIYVILILLIIISFLLALNIAYVTIDIHLKNQLLFVSVGNKLYKRKFEIDFSEKKPAPSNDADKPSKKQDSPFSASSLKKRIYNAENGIDFEEVKNIRTEAFETYSDIITIIKKFFGRLRYKVQIPVVRVKMEYGTGDAAVTGMLYGSIWGLVGTLYPIISGWAHTSYPTLDITPDFYGKRFNIETRSIIKVRPAHIISALFAALSIQDFTYLKDKFKKGRGKNGRQTSN